MPVPYLTIFDSRDILECRFKFLILHFISFLLWHEPWFIPYKQTRKYPTASHLSYQNLSINNFWLGKFSLTFRHLVLWLLNDYYLFLQVAIADWKKKRFCLNAPMASIKKRQVGRGRTSHFFNDSNSSKLYITV